jgi:branched-chain amino acid transport system ATP-binding protein
MRPALALDKLAVRFGGVQAVDGVTLSIAPGEFVGLIGPNGAGKTTLIRIVAGILQPDRGSVRLDGVDVTGTSTAARVRQGLALTHQIVRPFREMTVLENVVLAAGYRRTAHPLLAMLQADRKSETERAIDILAGVGLGGTESRLAGTLPLGQMKRLEVARALAVDPKVILLDEPLAGLNHVEAGRQVEVIAALNARGITVVLVEHNLDEVMRNCRRLVVLNNGQVIGDGEPKAVMADPVVHDAYVGSGAGSEADAEAR